MTVLGAGIVGIYCAIELQRAGFEVALLDHREPGSETSSGNAGILSLGSIAPLASPALLPRLPQLIANRYTDFRMHYPHLPQLLPWLMLFIVRCNRKTYLHDGALMNALTVASVDAHRGSIRESNSEHLVNELGGLVYTASLKHMPTMNSNASYLNFVVLIMPCWTRQKSGIWNQI